MSSNHKIKLSQELKPLDHQKRRMFLNWAEQQLENDSDFYRKIIFSDKAHFCLNGFVNKQNMRQHQSLLHPEKITVWCGLCDGGVIRPYFFLDYQDVHITVNGNRYRSMITDPPNCRICTWRTCGSNRTASQATHKLMSQSIYWIPSLENVLSHGSVGWSPRSCDLTPLDYFL